MIQQDAKEGMVSYWAKKNADSVDGLPGLKVAQGRLPLSQRIPKGRPSGPLRSSSSSLVGLLLAVLVALKWIMLFLLVAAVGAAFDRALVTGRLPRMVDHNVSS
jgi:hypothetical protein